MTLVGRPAPDFRMPSTKNMDTLEEDVALADHAGEWLILFFYPADFTFVCPTEVLAFSEAEARFAEFDAKVIGISTDSVYSHQAWIEFHLGKLSFPLAADVTHSVSRDYGVLLEDEGVAQRGLFIIDPEGVVRYEVVHDMDAGRNVDEIVRVLASLQAGGRVPANWAPGEATLSS
jgi:peroxiredoxin (alkyl hydroperoxide reductase subunit C)